MNQQYCLAVTAMKKTKQVIMRTNRKVENGAGGASVGAEERCPSQGG